MCSKYNRFLLSTCLPVMALTLCVSMPVHAGFEWTPPEKVEQVEVLPAPVLDDIPAPIPSHPVMTETLDETDQADSAMEPPVEEMQEPPVKITVIDDAPEEISTEEETATPEKVDIIVIEEHIDDVPMEIEDDHETVETVIIEHEEELAEEPVVTAHEQENTVIEAMDVETSKAPVKEAQPVAAPDENALTLNPYPLENAPQGDIAPAQANDEITWNEPQHFDVIEGFGTDMPLALALRQIVPPQYAFSFGNGVNPGMRISWQGGKAWNEVLADALAPAGVNVGIHNKKVLLRTDNTVQPTTTEEAAVEETIKPAFEDDVAAVEKEGITHEDTADNMVEDAYEDTAEEISESVEHVEDALDEAADTTPAAAPEKAMNDALHDVYGTTDDAVPDDAPIQLEKATSTMVEELLEPVETIEDQEAIPAPDMDALSDEAENIVIERTNILDPGQAEGTQPAVSIDEKKN